ncbi:hypothetical protein MLD38_000474 [Melastoma candidum]|uniref:Uncharacterized protein n=1 Tax=Melastoma candidum TaxID=119954 RepID=A0ACB9SF49_9MYRT|nr:hypothetical protein MLD38_000474 [Melastoma candidum]
MYLEDVASTQMMGPFGSRYPGGRSLVKEVIPSESSASFVSRESFTNTLRATGLPTEAQDTSGSPLHSAERSPEHKNPAHRIPENVLETLSIAECRNLLHHHALNLLETAGWLIRKHKRPSRQTEEYKFTSPGGRSVRELCRAWRICGEMLISEGSTMVQGEDLKEWDCFSVFRSDVKGILARVETEFTASASSDALAHRWILLDPFISVFFIDKKIGALRKGEVVKVSRSCAAGNEEFAPLDWKNKFHNRDSIRRRNISVAICNSSDDQKTGSKVLALCAMRRNHGCGRQSSPGSCMTLNASVDILTRVSTSMVVKHSDANKSCPSKNMQLPTLGYHNAGLLPMLHGCDVSTTLDDFGIQPVERRAISRQCSCEETLPCHEGSGARHVEGDARGAEEDTSSVTSEIGDALIKGKDEENIGKLPLAVDQCSKLHSSLFRSDCPSCKLQCDHKSGSHAVSCSGDSGFFEQCDHGKMLYILSTSRDVTLGKKMESIPEIDSTTFSNDDGLFRQTNLPHLEAPDFGVSDFLDHLDEGNNNKVTRKNSNDGEKSQSLALCYRNSHKKREREKGSGDTIICKSRTKRSRKCDAGNDDILLSIVVPTDKVIPFVPHPIPRRKANTFKDQSNGWRLLPRSLGKTSKLLMEQKWSLLGSRTVLSWLINAGVISPNDVVQYRDLEDNTIIKDGLITWDGVICKCCSQVLSVSQFKIHSGFKSNHICLNLFMKESGPFSLCALEAWSSEYKMRKNARVAVLDYGDDHNDDLCAVCGDAGELICCDNCPATYHQSCLLTKDMPEGDWYCPSCRCRICQELVDYQNPTSSFDAMKCSQCEHKYHKSCLKRRNGVAAVVNGCFCGGSCQQAHSVLQSRVGLMNHLADGYSWILLRCFHDDIKFPSAAKVAFKAECNSKLAVALSLMEECFVSMVDPRTGIDMIPHVLYNWGSDFARLNFDNFYTVVLENDDILIAAASIRVHGVAIAEMPLIATCSKYRRQGMCRRLMAAVEELLVAIKVEKLVIAALPELIETWTKGFEFQIVEDYEKQTLLGINLMVFPGTVLLKKTLHTKPAHAAVICCGLEAGGWKAEAATEICCALEAEPDSVKKGGLILETRPVATAVRTEV